MTVTTASRERPHNFVLPSGALFAGSTYTFELTASTSDGAEGVSYVFIEPRRRASASKQRFILKATVSPPSVIGNFDCGGCGNLTWSIPRTRGPVTCR